jgi:hypothetical protein
VWKCEKPVKDFDFYQLLRNTADFYTKTQEFFWPPLLQLRARAGWTGKGCVAFVGGRVRSFLMGLLLWHACKGAF